MNMKRKHTYRCLLAWGLAGLVGCGGLPEKSLPETDGDKVQVKLTVAGEYGAPFSDLQSPLARAGEDYERDLGQYTPAYIPDGTTLWISITEMKDGVAQGDSFLKSYVVKEMTLYPCVVDDKGELLYESTNPLYLDKGKTYRLRAMGPARKLTDDNRLYVQNGEYVFANDNRYEQTKGTEVEILEQGDQVYTVELNPLIQQTAQLKFTVEVASDADGYSPIHALEVMPIGVEISGLQEHYCRRVDDEGNFIPAKEESEPWNWQWGTTYLKTYPGKVYNVLTLYEPVSSSEKPLKIVFRTAILPTDAVANPIIVMFNLRVNGVPTQFEMMLNRKMFLAAYSYHYKGTIDIQDGIACMEWQSVNFERHKPLPVITNKKTN